ncbi:MAG: hypothetical protein HZB53_08480 [Chloroflexi bacterium]|nr:hypothetical protein [Chloroflexota bacterium]
MVRVDSIQIGRDSSDQFTAMNVFKPGDNLVVRAHVTDNNGNSVSHASVTLAVLKPDGTAQCTSTGLTDDMGDMTITCSTLQQSPVGVWTVRLRTVSRTGYGTDMTQSVMWSLFTLQ